MPNGRFGGMPSFFYSCSTVCIKMCELFFIDFGSLYGTKSLIRDFVVPHSHVFIKSFSVESSIVIGPLKMGSCIKLTSLEMGVAFNMKIRSET